MKRQYIIPTIETLSMMSEGIMQIISIDNTGEGGADGEKQNPVTDNDNGDINVGSKENDVWGNSYSVWK